MFIFELVKHVEKMSRVPSRVPLQMLAVAEATDSVTECHRGFFCGSDWVWAWLDLGIVLISLAEITGDIVTKASKSWLDDSWRANDFASCTVAGARWYMVYGSLVDVRQFRVLSEFGIICSVSQ